jgi:MurNAc alpha-1-phosphate uridylyltransferase
VTDDSLCGVVLAAGEGVRLRPLTLLRPKPLCPVANVPLLDHALGRMSTVATAVAVNLHHGRDQLSEHLAAWPQPPHLSVEEPEALGTAGAIGQLRPWIAGRDVCVINADTWCPGSLEPAVATWDRERVRLVLQDGGGLRPGSRLVAAFMPWSEVAPLAAEPSGLYEVSWRRLASEGRIETWSWDGPCIDCGTPARYLTANLAAAEGKSVIGPGALVAGTVERSVVWDGAEVHAAEHLVDAIRAARGVTVLVR